ncbi:hypothetical protein U1Q18_026552, partial [Sarracenia purpurea var. burkii]
MMLIAGWKEAEKGCNKGLEFIILMAVGWTASSWWLLDSFGGLVASGRGLVL